MRFNAAAVSGVANNENTPQASITNTGIPISNSKGKNQKNKKITPLEGIEPSTYGLEVHRAIHCAIGAIY